MRIVNVELDGVHKESNSMTVSNVTILSMDSSLHSTRLNFFFSFFSFFKSKSPYRLSSSLCNHTNCLKEVYFHKFLNNNHQANACFLISDIFFFSLSVHLVKLFSKLKLNVGIIYVCIHTGVCMYSKTGPRSVVHLVIGLVRTDPSF